MKTKRNLDKKAFFYLVFLLFLFSLGCIEGAGLGSQAGLVITKFGSDVTEVEATGTDVLELTLDLQNTGSALASSINAELFNYGGFIGITNRSLGQLSPPTDTTPGEVRDAVFALTIPKRDLGITEKAEFGVHVSYDYESRGSKTVYVLPRGEWQVKHQLGISGVNKGSQATVAPVILGIRAKEPIVVDKYQDTFTLEVNLENIGNGVVRSKSSGLNVIDAVDLIVPPGFVKSDYCDFNGDLGGSGGVLTIQDAPNRLALSNGRFKTLVCRLKVIDIGNENVYNFLATAHYTYVADAYYSVVLRGTE